MFSELRRTARQLAGVLAGPFAPRGDRVAISPAFEAFLQKHGGGRMGRLWRDWVLRPLESAEREVLRDLRRARRAARELVGTWGPAARWARLCEENIIGHQGIRLRVKLTKAKGLPDLKRNQRVERTWQRWGRKETCDVARQRSWRSIERQLVIHWARDGEAILRMHEGWNNEFGFAVQILDPDQLDDRLNVPMGPNQNRIIGGVEIDQWGGPVAFHLWNEHPHGDANRRQRERIPASQILHWFDQTRAGQHRGLPRLLASLVAAKYTMAYEEAEVIGARANSVRMGFYTRNPDVVGDPRKEQDEEEKIPWEADPGAIGLLPPGWEFQDWSPSHPGNNYAMFMKGMMRSIASGVLVAYNTLANDLEGVNFSSLRGGMLTERDRWRIDQDEMISAIHATAFPRWVAWSVVTGALPAKDIEAADCHDFQPRGWPWVDPLKDIQADILAINAGLWSRTRSAAARGIDLDEVFMELVAEQQLAAELGLEIRVDLGAKPIAAADSSDDDDESTTNGGNDDGADRALRNAWSGVNGLRVPTQRRIPAPAGSRDGGTAAPAERNGSGLHSPT